MYYYVIYNRYTSEEKFVTRFWWLMYLVNRYLNDNDLTMEFYPRYVYEHNYNGMIW